MNLAVDVFCVMLGCVTAIGRSGGPRCSVVRVRHFNGKAEHYTTSNKSTTETAPSDAKHTKQKTTTHTTQVGKGYLSMVLNQRQR